MVMLEVISRPTVPVQRTLAYGQHSHTVHKANVQLSLTAIEAM